MSQASNPLELATYNNVKNEHRPTWQCLLGLPLATQVTAPTDRFLFRFISGDYDSWYDPILINGDKDTSKCPFLRRKTHIRDSVPKQHPSFA